jgi:hypothetical protein
MPQTSFHIHIARAKELYETVRTNCSETVLPFYYIAATGNIGNIYSDRGCARSEEEYYSNLETGLDLQHSALKLVSKSHDRVDWGILQHNLGCSYTKFSKLQTDEHRFMDVIDKAIYHLELSFEVRDPTDMLQYWVASCRSLGDALIERSAHLINTQAHDDLERAYDILSRASSMISETQHPNQWSEVQKQLARCSEQRLRAASRDHKASM